MQIPQSKNQGDTGDLHSMKIAIVVMFALVLGVVFAETVQCRYCGTQMSSVRGLVALQCPRHPLGMGKGKHAPFEGASRETFVCIHCGQKAGTLHALVSLQCPRHPNGPGKGRHEAFEGRTGGPYVCRFCGNKASSMQSLVTLRCPRHPNGSGKGCHSPMR